MWNSITVPIIWALAWIKIKLNLMALSMLTFRQFQRGATFHLLQKLLVSCCRRYLLQKFTSYLLQKLLVAKNHLLLVSKFTCYSWQKLIVAKVHLLLQNSLLAENHLLLLPKFSCYLLAAINHLLLNAKNHSSLVKTITSP